LLCTRKQLSSRFTSSLVVNTEVSSRLNIEYKTDILLAGICQFCLYQIYSTPPGYKIQSMCQKGVLKFIDLGLSTMHPEHTNPLYGSVCGTNCMCPWNMTLPIETSAYICVVNLWYMPLIGTLWELLDYVMNIFMINWWL
jgi:hypothetical protein